MANPSPAQSIAGGVIAELAQPQPLILEPEAFGVVAEILNGFTGALAAAAGIKYTGLPTTQQLRGKVTLDEVQVRMLRALLVEYVKIPTEP